MAQELTSSHGAVSNHYVPGTIHLVDVQGLMRAKHASSGARDVVLVPAPSSDPDDPLNWSPARKKLSVFCMAIYVLVIGIACSALYSTLYPLSHATGLSVADLNAGTGYMFLAFGWGCLPWQAFAIQYGKRPVYLITLLGTVGVSIWQPHIKSNGEWIAAKLLQGFFGAPIESLAEISVSDVFFTHDRGKYIAVYALALGYSNGIAPLIMGFINSGQGWQWVFHWCAIFCAVTFVYLFFFMEETNFDRPGVTGMELEEGDSKVVEGEKIEHQQATTVEHEGTVTTPKKSFWVKLKIFQPGVFGLKNYLGLLMTRPLVMITLPIVSYAGFLYGSNIIWLSVLNATESLVLANEPYNFETWQVGLTFIAPLIGTTLACLYTGLFGDWLIVKLARRNQGYMEAEFRLWLFVPSLFLIPFANILFGVGAAHGVHWFALVFAMGTISFTTTAGSQTSIAYLIDAYRDLSSEALVTVILIRNTMAFGIGYAVTPWVTNLGYQNAFLLAAGLGLAHNLTIFPVVKWGRVLRKQTAARYWKYLQFSREHGIAH